ARGNDLLRAGDFSQFFKPRLRHRDFADVRLDGAKRIVRRLRGRRLRQRIEQGGLADVRQPDDAALESHDYPLTALRSSSPGHARLSGVKGAVTMPRGRGLFTRRPILRSFRLRWEIVRLGARRECMYRESSDISTRRGSRMAKRRRK